MATECILLWMLTHAAIGATAGEEVSLPTRNEYGGGRANEKGQEYERKFTCRTERQLQPAPPARTNDPPKSQGFFLLGNGTLGEGCFGPGSYAQPFS